MKNKRKITMYISLHAYGPAVLIPWGYIDQKVEDYDELVIEYFALTLVILVIIYYTLF